MKPSPGPFALIVTIHLQVRWEMRHYGGSSEPGNFEKPFEVWEGRFLPTGSVGDAAKIKPFETALGLNQAASQASQPGPAAAAAGTPAADGGGGDGTDVQVIELARKIFRGGSSNQTTRTKERNLRGAYSNSQFQICLCHELIKAMRLISFK